MVWQTGIYFFCFPLIEKLHPPVCSTVPDFKPEAACRGIAIRTRVEQIWRWFYYIGKKFIPACQSRYTLCVLLSDFSFLLYASVHLWNKIGWYLNRYYSMIFIRCYYKNTKIPLLTAINSIALIYHTLKSEYLNNMLSE